MIPCRLIDNNGDISEGIVRIDRLAEIMGITKPQPVVHTYTSTFAFDHLTDRGVAVYLEVL